MTRFLGIIYTFDFILLHQLQVNYQIHSRHCVMFEYWCPLEGQPFVWIHDQLDGNDQSERAFKIFGEVVDPGETSMICIV